MTFTLKQKTKEKNGYFALLDDKMVYHPEDKPFYHGICTGLNPNSLITWK